MKRILISTTISLLLSAALLSGIPDLSKFAFYVSLICNVLVWIGLLAGAAKGEAARKIRKYVWVSTPNSAIQLGALIFSGHPVLAASSFMATTVLLVAVFSTKGDKPCEQ